ncbi:MAG TPA: TraR/DksA family transcriptional regulator [Burkholderiales bacterium]|nr:TraR/DksA family transcriptional regulator [Burkholderiales bacterium]
MNLTGVAMTAPGDKDTRQFEQRLVERREDLRRHIHDALIASQREEYIELAGSVHDVGDESVAELLTGMRLSTVDREVTELQDVEAALERIKHGSFGKCSDCGDTIDRERLTAYPTAKRCLTCQTRYETQKRGGRDATPSL